MTFVQMNVKQRLRGSADNRSRHKKQTCMIFLEDPTKWVLTENMVHTNTPKQTYTHSHDHTSAIFTQMKPFLMRDF